MATRKTAGAGKRRTGRGTRSTTTPRTATSSTRRTVTRRTSSGALYPRRRRSRPGLPTTVGAALGTVLVTALLDLSWPVRIALVGLVLVGGLVYVLWRHRAEIAAAGAAPDVAPQPASEGAPTTETAGDSPTAPPVG